MAEEPEVKMPLSIIRGAFTILLVIGVLLYVGWTVLLIIEKGIFFDLGLYSICVVMILMGLFGRLLYGHKIKQEQTR